MVDRMDDAMPLLKNLMLDYVKHLVHQENTTWLDKGPRIVEYASLYDRP